MEGPSLVILHEELKPFIGKKILRVSGNTREPKETLEGRTLAKVDTWAKVLFLTFAAPKRKNSPPIVTKTHFMMFGSYRIDEPKEDRVPRLRMDFANGTVYFYACSIRFGADEYLANVDREVDVMSPRWKLAHVLRKMREKKSAYLCDLFLDQTVFAGSGNIVKNEVLFNLRRHPLTPLTRVPEKDWPKLAQAVRSYCFDFYAWKKKYELRRHWQVYRKWHCPLCQSRLVRENLGKFDRKTFYCENCQSLPKRAAPVKVHKVLPIAPAKTKEVRLDH